MKSNYELSCMLHNPKVMLRREIAALKEQVEDKDWSIRTLKALDTELRGRGDVTLALALETPILNLVVEVNGLKEKLENKYEDLKKLSDLAETLSPCEFFRPKVIFNAEVTALLKRATN